MTAANRTIFAPATAAGRAGIAVIRLSGPATARALLALSRREAPPPPRRAARCRFRDAAGALIDDGLVLWFPGPASYSGEDMAELHLHGGPAVLAAMARALAALGLAPAAPGEFSRRAFDNGKLDLLEIEGLADLVAAETEAQRRQALLQLEGELSALYEGWRATLLGALARAEAAIDFPDEDLPPDLAAASDAMLAVLARAIAAHLDDGGRGERLRDGLSVVLLGAPNVGKSSLMNRLAGYEAAIVSARAGTTRDVVEVRLALAGYPVLIADTAGLRESTDEIESEGVRRARDRAARADLKLLLVEAAAWPAGRAAIADLVDGNALVVLNKADLAAATPPPGGLLVSARTGAGVEELLARIAAAARERLAAGDTPVLTRLRHRQALSDCLESLQEAMQTFDIEIKAEGMRTAARALGRITGRVDVEAMLDVLFGSLCIGK